MKNELKTLYKKNPKLAIQAAKVWGYKIKVKADKAEIELRDAGMDWYQVFVSESIGSMLHTGATLTWLASFGEGVEKEASILNKRLTDACKKAGVAYRFDKEPVRVQVDEKGRGRLMTLLSYSQLSDMRKFKEIFNSIAK